MRRGFGLEVAAIALVVSSCTVGPSEIPSPPATVSLSASPGPTAAVSSTPAPTASASSASGLPIVRTTALGQVTGNWLFYGVRIPRPEPDRIEVQIAAVPVGGGAATIVVAFDAHITTRTNSGTFDISDNAPYLRRRFSPDGRRMVLSIDGQLVVVDLVSGQAKPLGVRGYYPSWSRDGSQIAFVLEKPVADTGATAFPIGVVPAAGGSPRELRASRLPYSSSTVMVAVLVCVFPCISYDDASIEWSPDGSRIFSVNHYPPGDCADVCPDHATMEVATGRIGTRIGWVSLAPSYAHWRAGAPELAIATRSVSVSDLTSGSNSMIVGIDEGTGNVRTLVDVAEQVQLRDPRWNPAVADELLYVAERADFFETHVVNIRTGKDTRLPISAYEATWIWDGSAIAYLAKSPGLSFGSALHVWKRDGSGETELRRATGGQAFFSIASVNY